MAILLKKDNMKIKDKWENNWEGYCNTPRRDGDVLEQEFADGLMWSKKE